MLMDGCVVWVCVAALAILGRLDLVDRDLTGAWLSERQLPNGGLNGRPEKLEDVSDLPLRKMRLRKLGGRGDETDVSLIRYAIPGGTLRPFRSLREHIGSTETILSTLSSLRR